MFGLVASELNTITGILRSLNVKKCKIFGSRAKGNYKKGSDIDMAIIGDERKISYYLNEESNLPYFFDVINLTKISSDNLIDHIERVGKDIL